MTEAIPAGAAFEYPVFIPAPGGDLLAVVTEPTVAPNGVAVIMLRGAGWRPSSGPRRTQVATARRLAALGFHGIRFSYHGVAESGGVSPEIVRLDRPNIDDTRAVVSWVAQQGLRPFLAGNCSGARNAVAYVAGGNPVAALVLVVPPVHDFEVARRLDRRPLSKLARRVRPSRLIAVLRDRARRQALGRSTRALMDVAGRRLRSAPDAGPEWVSRRFVSQLSAVVRQGVPVLFVYGEDDSYRRDFELARGGELGRVLDRAGPLVRVEVVTGRVHGLASVATQEAVLATIERWITTTFDAVAPASAVP